MKNRKSLFQKLKAQIINDREKVELYSSYSGLIKKLAKKYPLHIFDDLVGDAYLKLVEIIETVGIINWDKVKDDDPTPFIWETLKCHLIDRAKYYLQYHDSANQIDPAESDKQIEKDLDERIQKAINLDKNKKRKLYKETIIKLKKMNYSYTEIAKIIDLSASHVYRLMEQIRHAIGMSDHEMREK